MIGLGRMVICSPCLRFCGVKPIRAPSWLDTIFPTVGGSVRSFNATSICDDNYARGASPG